MVRMATLGLMCSFGLIRFALKDSLPRLHDMKLTVIALTAILALPPSSYPPSFLAVLQNLVTTAIDVAHTHEKSKIGTH